MHSFETLTLGFYMPSGWEWLVILVIALLVFGKRLPDVGRSLGKGIVEFKKGLKGMKDELDSVEREVEEASNRSDEEEEKQPAEKPQLESSQPEPAVNPQQAHKEKAEPGTT